MMRESVASSNIASIGYDDASETLEIEFHNGTIYQFYNVSQGVYEQLISAPSKGQFFSAYIRPAFPYSRVG